MFMRNLSHIVFALCLLIAVCVSDAFAQHGRLPVPLPAPPTKPAPGDESAPTMKKPETVSVAPARTRRAYDPAHNTTYVNVEITLIAHTDDHPKGGAVAFSGREVTLTFQLAYRGAHTEDMTAAYLILESTGAQSEADRFGAVKQLEVKADAYQYDYARVDYQAGAALLTGAAQANAPPLKRETLIFKILTADLPQLADANELKLQAGAETFTVKSRQLTDLRRTLANGGNQ
ncbi:MAG: hypothetical protein QOF61_3410 [Acidobacteriota bacterium]|jgi:hypothetical protein|nr:hypothetical protein [Acidobacteriota bacterium]